MENQLTIVLPQEVAQIAESVSIEKRNEVQTVLNHVFNGVSKMREQLDGVTVADPNDKVNMKLANTIRLGVRQVRLKGEEIFDAKRLEVQQRMAGDKAEDALWLKSKQVMQILTKEIEQNARWKEETKERYEAEQKELKVQQRILKIAKVAPEMARTEFESMSDETFEMFFTGIEKAYNDNIEAEKKAEEERIEKEKKNIIHAERTKIALPFYEFWSEFEKKLHLGEQSESDFDNFMTRIQAAKANKELQIEKQRKENERLKAEAEAKEKQLAYERAKAEAERKKIEEAAKKEREENERKLKAEQESARIAAEKAASEKQKLEAEIKAKQDADEKARKEAEAKIIADQKLKEAAEKKAKNAPDKTKLIELASQIDGLNMPEIKSEEAQKILADVKILLSKVSVFIREKSSGL